MTFSERIVYGEDPSQFVDVSRPDGESCGQVVSIHGGYWRSTYGLDLHQPIVEHLNHQQWTVYNIEYRRVPDTATPEPPGVWSEMSADVLAACDLVTDGSGPTVAIGHSAGGQLALWAASQRQSKVDAVVALAPVADLVRCDELALSDNAVQLLLGGSADGLPNLYQTASPRHLLPLGVPQLIVHGQADVHVPLEMATSYVETAIAAGDDTTLLSPETVDHFDVIDPAHEVWRTIDQQLAAWK